LWFAQVYNYIYFNGTNIKHQILASDGNVGILEDLRRRTSILRVMLEIRWQRVIETEEEISS